MKVLSIIIFKYIEDQPIILASSYFLSSLGFFYRSTAKELCIFASRTLTQLSKKNQSYDIVTSLHQNEYVCYVKLDRNGLAFSCVCDEEYPSYVIPNLIKKIQTEFNSRVSSDDYSDIKTDDVAGGPKLYDLDILLEEAQNPSNIDKIEKIKEELDETKKMVISTLDKLLDRGENIEDLVKKSKDLSEASKILVIDTKKMNSCCPIL